MPTFKDCKRVAALEKRRSLGNDMQRPLTAYEQQIVDGLHSFASIMDLGREVMHKRNKEIKRGAARMGLIKWACRSLYADYMQQLTEDGRQTFQRRAHSMQLSVVVRKIQDNPDDGWKMCEDKTLRAVARAAWAGNCQFCALAGQEAKKCELRKALDGLQCIEPSDNPACWYRGD